MISCAAPTIRSACTCSASHPRPPSWLFRLIPARGLLRHWHRRDIRDRSNHRLWLDNRRRLPFRVLVVRSDEDIGKISNLCRCGTYPRIRKAIKRAADAMHETKK